MVYFNIIVGFILLKVALIWCGECPMDIDPCSSDVYKPLTDKTRKADYKLQAKASNDYILSKAWYRFMEDYGQDGGDMATEFTETGQCNAYSPIYLAESIPSPEQGIVMVNACASFLAKKCVREYSIPVKNCGRYRVYCLEATIDTYDRYCMSAKIACPEGLYSKTGFEPGCEFCEHYDLTFKKKKRYSYEISQVANPRMNLNRALVGSGRQARIRLLSDSSSSNSAKLNISVNSNSVESIRVVRICAKVSAVTKIAITFFNKEGHAVESVTVDPEEYCFWDRDVQGVHHIELLLKTRRSAKSVKLSKLAIEACEH